MIDMEARRIIEALRSGVPSKAVGQYFSDARPQMMKTISDELEAVKETGISDGMVITGKYGEGKTHILNTVFNMAQTDNMVVSYISLSKETPMDKLHMIYPKIMNNTYLPNRKQPGLQKALERLSPNGAITDRLLLYAGKELETDKLYYLLKAYLNTDDPDERFLLQSDLEGDFVGNPQVKSIYKRIFNQTVKFNVNFSKTKHCQDYISFMSYLFKLLGYNGWVILVDEVELMGRLGKKARLNAYKNMAKFLKPSNQFHSIFSLFALSSSYTEDVIEGKHEFENLAEVYPDDQEPAKTVLNMMIKAPQLAPLTKEETEQVITKIQEFYGRAYDWPVNVSKETVLKAIKSSGFLLRTKIRAAIEFFDQLYLYGEAGDTQVTELGEERFVEDETPVVDEILNNKLETE